MFIDCFYYLQGFQLALGYLGDSKIIHGFTAARGIGAGAPTLLKVSCILDANPSKLHG